jgi:hypothetical protein
MTRLRIRSGERARVLCAWCPAVLEEGTPGAPESHGICDDCIRRYFPAHAEAVLTAKSCSDKG